MSIVSKCIYWGLVLGGIWKGVEYIFTIPFELIGKYALCISIVFGVFGTGTAVTIYKKLFSGKLSSTSNFVVPSLPDYHQYTKTNFKNINWSWQWRGGQFDNISAFCPKCCNRLEESNQRYDKETGYTCHSTVPIIYYCDNDNCDFSTDYIDDRKVYKEIERRINSGEYKKELSKK